VVKKGNPPGIRRQLEEWFDATPDAELTLRDITERFGISKEHASTIVWDLKQRGVVERVSVIRRAREA